MQGQSQKIIAGAMARASWRKPLRAEKVTMAMYNERCSGNFQKCGDIILDKLESRQTTLLVEIPPELKSRWSRETEHIYAIVRNGEVMKLGGTRTGMKKRWDSYKCGHCVPQRIQKRSGEPSQGRCQWQMLISTTQLRQTYLKGVIGSFGVGSYPHTTLRWRCQREWKRRLRLKRIMRMRAGQWVNSKEWRDTFRNFATTVTQIIGEGKWRGLTIGEKKLLRD